MSKEPKTVLESLKKNGRLPVRHLEDEEEASILATPLHYKAINPKRAEEIMSVSRDMEAQEGAGESFRSSVRNSFYLGVLTGGALLGVVLIIITLAH